MTFSLYCVCHTVNSFPFLRRTAAESVTTEAVASELSLFALFSLRLHSLPETCQFPSE